MILKVEALGAERVELRRFAARVLDALLSRDRLPDFAIPSVDVDAPVDRRYDARDGERRGQDPPLSMRAGFLP